MFAKNVLAYILVVGACCIAVPASLAILTVGTAELNRVSMMDGGLVGSGKSGHHAGHAKKAHHAKRDAKAHRHHGGGHGGVAGLGNATHA